MTSLEAWNLIIKNLEGKTIELPTVPKTKKIPVWFSASTNGEIVIINEATEHEPSSKLSAPRILKYNTFQKVFPLYLRREKGEAVSSEVTATTVNQVYYFSLIKHFCFV
jgi:thymidine phosphorylase